MKEKWEVDEMGRFSFHCDPVCPNVVYQQENLRLTLITPRMLRIEKSSYTDMPTQTVWNRNLGDASWELSRQGSVLSITTDAVSFSVDTQKGRVVSVTLSDGTVVKNFSGGNLPGTARTLDTVNGGVKMEKGILSRSGVSLLDDSVALLLERDGGILPRPECTDVYCFAYGHDYQTQLKDFFRLSGAVPLIPKFALGNWWSRYRAYTQEEYRQLMQSFIDRKLPFTVATIDMDWHWTDVVERFGEAAKPDKPKCPQDLIYNLLLQGWTGYTWNTELFPDHRELLSWLHENGFHVPLNVHPSQGIRFYEACYEAVCARMGKDPKEKQYIPFDIADRQFVDTYFEDVHHPLEAEGVDFWWIDWQQGTKTKIPGLDPLWALNHYHTLDAGRGEKRPLILSRYAGLGSHRYPLGFSGDTITTWKSLDFQPYFTNSAANSGYTWWSHDIGGHMKGIQDDELYLRWLQYGVFSPINRLHSSNSDFMGKEPWKRSWAVSEISNRFLRLRHRMIPYLYTSNYDTHTKGIPICMPIYYRYDCEDAYSAKNQYIFGGQLLVCPITKPADKRLNLASTKVWLPEGKWTDVFTGWSYHGGGWVTMHRDLDSIPVLAPEGAIIPLYQSGESNNLSLEQPLEINLWSGSGHYDLYEDDGETNAYLTGEYAITHLELERKGDTLRFTITPPGASDDVLPAVREMDIRFRDIASADVTVDGLAASLDMITLTVSNQPVCVELKNIVLRTNPPKEELRSAILTRVQGSNTRKSRRFGKNKLPLCVRSAIEELDALL